MFSIPQLRHFQLVAREASFSRAAEVSNITQSALSNSIRGLEEKLGFDVFERSHRPVTLTALGSSFLEQVDRLLFEARNVEAEARNLRSGVAGSVRVGMSAVMSASFGGQILAAWHEAYPQVHIDFLARPTPELLKRLYEENLDFIVGDQRELPRRSNDLEMLSMPRQRGGAFCRPDHPILSIKDLRFADLMEYRFAGTHFPDEVKAAFYGQVGPEAEKHNLIKVDSQDVSTLRDAAASSDLIILTTAACVRNEIAYGVLKEIPLKMTAHGEWSIVRLIHRVMHPAVPKMIDMALEIAERETSLMVESGQVQGSD